MVLKASLEVGVGRHALDGDSYAGIAFVVNYISHVYWEYVEGNLIAMILKQIIEKVGPPEAHSANLFESWVGRELMLSI